MSFPPEVGLLAAVLVLLVLVAVALWRRRREGPVPPAPGERVTSAAGAVETTGPPRAALVLNPSKFDDADTTVDLIDQLCARQGWQPCLRIDTSVEDPGQGPAQAALDAGCDLILVAGGDGTVRSVVEVVAGSGVPVGLLPAGTGNLLARNLDLDITDLGAAVHTALTGRSRPIDVGRIVVDVTGQDADPAEQVFCVMAGMGFDAAIMAGAPEALKARVGWLAYVVGGARSLRGRQSRVQLTVDGRAPLSRRVRTVVVGNCGKLTGGFTLMPDAELDDGWLDAVALAPQGVVGWAGVGAQLVTRQRKGHRRVEHLRCREITIAAAEPEEAEIDGDPVGKARTLRIRIDPEALVVRVP